MYPAPCTLHSTPQTLSPALRPLNPKPCILYLELCTLHPAPYTLHPESNVMNPLTLKGVSDRRRELLEAPVVFTVEVVRRGRARALVEAAVLREESTSRARGVRPHHCGSQRAQGRGGGGSLARVGGLTYYFAAQFQMANTHKHERSQHLFARRHHLHNCLPTALAPTLPALSPLAAVAIPVEESVLMRTVAHCIANATPHDAIYPKP
jgi:hypothetical protein